MWWVSGIAIILYVAIFIAIIVAAAEIFIKAGYSRWFCFLMIIPVVNLIVFFWFAYSKWPIHEFVEPSLRIKRLQQEKGKLEQELKSLSEVDSGKQNKKLKHNHQLRELHQEYNLAKKLSKDHFLAAANYPDNSPEKESHFRMGTEYKQKAEVLEMQLDKMQDY
jgi:hypothetical protein